MSAGTRAADRRRAVRSYYSDVPVSWRKPRSDRWTPGRLSDVSADGVALLVGAGGEPEIGRMIEVMRNGARRGMLCRVVRTEARPGERTLVACRITAPNRSRAWLQGSTRIQKARRRLVRGMGHAA